MGRKLSSPNRDPWSTKPQIFIIWSLIEKVCQLLSLTNFQVFSFTHSNTIVSNAGIDTNIHSMPQRILQIQEKAHNKIWAWASGNRPRQVIWAKEDPNLAYTFLKRSTSEASQIFGGKSFLCPTLIKVRGVRTLPTGKMDCVCNHCILENTQRSWKRQQARNST